MRSPRRSRSLGAARPCGPPGILRLGHAILVAGLALACARGTATAAGAEPAHERAASPNRFAVGIQSGATFFDPHLADYQWDTAPRTAWGAQAIAQRGRFGLGLRVWRARTTQRLDLDGAANPAVRSTTVDLVGRGRITSRWGTDLEAVAAVGRIHLGYAPDRISIPSGSGAPIVVALSPIDAWSSGGGLALRHAIARAMSATLELDTQAFGMATAHRSGDTVIVEQERFREWSARFEIARWFGRR